MSKYSICILDDKIPASSLSDYMDDSKILNRNNFRHILTIKEQDWEEQQLYQLINKLYKKPEEYEITGFTSHSLFFNYIEENIFSPDIIIFDWDVGETNPKDNLLNLLKEKYCLVAVYTGADSQDEIKMTIEREEFDEYRERLFIQTKGEDNSIKKLEDGIKKRLQLFSFKLNQVIKKNTLQSVDNILINIGKLSFSQFVSLFGENKNGEKEISKTDFTNIFLEKLKYELSSIGISDVELKTHDENIDDINLIRKLWHYRLYHKCNDSVIRKGDIIKKGNKYFLVIASDCHLNKFWKSSLGYLTIIPLHKISKQNRGFTKRINYRKDLESYSLTSLVNPRIDFLTILPSLVEKDSEFYDYALNPREISSFEVALPDGGNGDKKLTIDDVKGYEKYISLSEPFISSLFLFITQKFSGFGLPDFSKELQKSIRENLKKLKK